MSGFYRQYAELAGRHGLELVAYEGGQNLVAMGPYSRDPALIDLFAAANRDPRMKQLYLENFARWTWGVCQVQWVPRTFSTR